MTSGARFQFSQASLQEYVDCPRRFQLRYVRRLRWPAVQAEPAWEGEEYLQRGRTFHRLIQQHVAGVPTRELSRTVADPEVRRWWRNYLQSPPKGLPGGGYAETSLSVPIGRSRLVARYDFLSVDTGLSMVIVDWKTSRKRPDRTRVLGRLQTRVYPYVLVRAGAPLNGGTPIRPEQVSMIYWYANFPALPERFHYSRDQFRVDDRFLSNLVAEIEERFEEAGRARLLPPDGNVRTCQYCCYRSLCERGAGAGLYDEMIGEELSEELADLEVDFEQIAEFEYG